MHVPVGLPSSKDVESNFAESDVTESKLLSCL